MGARTGARGGAGDGGQGATSNRSLRPAARSFLKRQRKGAPPRSLLTPSLFAEPPARRRRPWSPPPRRAPSSRRHRPRSRLAVVARKVVACSAALPPLARTCRGPTITIARGCVVVGARPNFASRWEWDAKWVPSMRRPLEGEKETQMYCVDPILGLGCHMGVLLELVLSYFFESPAYM